MKPLSCMLNIPFNKIPVDLVTHFQEQHDKMAICFRSLHEII